MLLPVVILMISCRDGLPLVPPPCKRSRMYPIRHVIWIHDWLASRRTAMSSKYNSNSSELRCMYYHSIVVCKGATHPTMMMAIIGNAYSHPSCQRLDAPTATACVMCDFSKQQPSANSRGPAAILHSIQSPSYIMNPSSSITTHTGITCFIVDITSRQSTPPQYSPRLLTGLLSSVFSSLTIFCSRSQQQMALLVINSQEASTTATAATFI